MECGDPYRSRNEKKGFRYRRNHDGSYKCNRNLIFWTGTSSFTPVLAVQNNNYNSGYAGLEVNGGAGTVYNFRAGGISEPPDTTIAESSATSPAPPNVAFSFTASEGGATFECSMDGGAFSACTSPKSYTGSGRRHAYLQSPRDRSRWDGCDTCSAQRASRRGRENDHPYPDREHLSRSEGPLTGPNWLKVPWATEIGSVWNNAAYHGLRAASGPDAGGPPGNPLHGSPKELAWSPPRSERAL